MSTHRCDKTSVPLCVRRLRHQRRAVALAIALAVLFFLGIVAGVLLRQSAMSITAARHGQTQLQAELLAIAALERAHRKSTANPAFRGDRWSPSETPTLVAATKIRSRDERQVTFDVTIERERAGESIVLVSQTKNFEIPQSDAPSLKE